MALSCIEHPCYVGLLGSDGQQPFYFQDLAFIETGQCIFTSSHVMVIVPLVEHIGRVLFWGSYKQMIWVATGRVVALVTYIHALRDFTMEEKPYYPIGWPCFFSESETSISI